MTPTLLYRQQHGKGLGGLLVESGRLDLADHDIVGVSQRLQSLSRHRPQTTHRQSWSGERMAPDDFVGQPQFQPQPAHFILEQVAQRFDQLETQFLRQPTHVVVRLDRRRRAVDSRSALDHVGIERPLGQEIGHLRSAVASA